MGRIEVTQDDWCNRETITVIDDDNKNQKMIRLLEKDKVTNLCSNCRTRWKAYSYSMVCPFCGKMIQK